MIKRLPSPPAPGPLENFAANFDDLFGTLAQRRGFREYLQGLLLPRDRNKVLTALVGMEPIVGAQGAPAQRLQFFLSESAWDVAEIEARRLELVREDPRSSAPHERGVLIIDETGDRKDGTKTDHVGYQYLGSVGQDRQRDRLGLERLGRRACLLSPARGALHSGQAIGEGKERSRLSHQAPHSGGAGRARSGSIHTLPRGGGRLPLWRECGLRRGDVEGESSLRPESQAPQGKVGRGRSGAHPRGGRSEDEVEWP